MPRTVLGPAIAWLLVLPAAAQAAPSESHVDPRYPFTVELALGGVLSNPVNFAGTARPAVAVRALFLGPLGENFQGGGGVWVDGAGTVSALGGVRMLFQAEPWQSHAEVQAVADVVPRLAAGVRGGVGLAREIARGWRVGGALGGTVVLGNMRVVVDLGLSVSKSW